MFVSSFKFQFNSKLNLFEQTVFNNILLFSLTPFMKIVKKSNFYYSLFKCLVHYGFLILYVKVKSYLFFQNQVSIYIFLMYSILKTLTLDWNQRACFDVFLISFLANIFRFLITYELVCVNYMNSKSNLFSHKYYELEPIIDFNWSFFFWIWCLIDKNSSFFECVTLFGLQIFKWSELIFI